MKVIVFDIIVKKVYSELNVPYAAAPEDKVFLNSFHCKKKEMQIFNSAALLALFCLLVN